MWLGSSSPRYRDPWAGGGLRDIVIHGRERARRRRFPEDGDGPGDDCARRRRGERREGARELACALETARDVLLEAAQDDRFELGRRIGPPPSERHRRV